MPTYRYRCTDCGNEFEQYQKFTDSALTVCPSCNGSIRRVIQPVGVVFKGSGWYINDSRKSDSSSSNGSKQSEKSESAEPAAAKSDASEKSDSAPKSEKKESAAKPAESKASAGATASA